MSSEEIRDVWPFNEEDVITFLWLEEDEHTVAKSQTYEERRANASSFKSLARNSLRRYVRRSVGLLVHVI